MTTHAAEDRGVQPIQAKTVPSISTVGSTPIFYNITVTQNRVEVVETAQYHADPRIGQLLLWLALHVPRRGAGS